MRLQHHIDALLVLDAIDRRGSFASAAEELHRATSSVTYAIQKLEEALDVKLFNRKGHRSVLTSAGRELLRDGRMLISSIQTIEQSVKLIATGWEAELRIAINDIVPEHHILNVLDEFYQEAPKATRIKIISETFLGPWDALISDRADFAIGIPSDVIITNNYQSHPLGLVEFLFVTSPNHPLAKVDTPISTDTLQKYRAIAAADSSRTLQPRSFGIIQDQTVLTVPNQQMKHQAIKQGLGVGHLPKHMILDDIKNGSLLIKKLASNDITKHTLQYAWPSAHKGKASQWLQNRLACKKQPIDWFDNHSTAPENLSTTTDQYAVQFDV